MILIIKLESQKIKLIKLAKMVRTKASASLSPRTSSIVRILTIKIKMIILINTQQLLGTQLDQGYLSNNSSHNNKICNIVFLKITLVLGKLVKV